MNKQKWLDWITRFLSRKPNVTGLEVYWNDKRPKTYRYTFPCRPLFDRLVEAQSELYTWNKDNMKVDPRAFFNVRMVESGRFNGLDSNDDKASACLDWVAKNVKYTRDKDPKEFWQFPFETLERKQGDCEDHGILIANMLLKAGVPYWRVRLNCGSVKAPTATGSGGHAWVTYLRESDDQWVILDPVYWYSESRGLKKLYSDAEKYFSIWFSWNVKYIYLDEEFGRKA